ncbi:MAG: YeeE/YedE family protein [Bacteroidetes bacterium]|nr:YeeE/YedE family protein [Bacteroidota bacterium]MCW5894944.1 YeeE/YedE family protein [Bacteroidota bacterium]
MNAPYFKFGYFGDEISLIVAFAIGIGFGFFLERAGFGSGRKLAAQFYLYDMTVFKVMFTAIVTAMVGLFWLSVFGIVDLSLVYVSPTYLVPQVVGGLILGVGFVVGGYCPGTSCVGVATGKYDAMIYLLGIIAGIFVFGEMFPLLEGFYKSTAMDIVTLPELFGMSYGLLVFLVVVMALGGFAGAEWVEKKFRKGAAQ